MLTAKGCPRRLSLSWVLPGYLSGRLPLSHSFPLCFLLHWYIEFIVDARVVPMKNDLERKETTHRGQDKFSNLELAAFTGVQWDTTTTPLNSARVNLVPATQT